MNERISESGLSDLLTETGEHHHQAYEDSDGTDPDWPLFYAGYLQTRLWDRLGRVPARSELVYLLVAADKEFQSTSQEQEQWSRFYAKFFLEYFAAS